MRKILATITKQRLLLFYTLLAGAIASVGLLLSPTTAHAASCEKVSIPVALYPGQPKDKTIVGTHCTPSSPSSNQSIDVLAPGGSYESIYWDFPFNNGQYSYVNRTLAANRATFNFDRIGTGESSKPLSATVTFSADAYTMHQAIQWLRTNRNYNDITTIGHSMGSIVAVQEAALYKDVDRVVATGFVHAPSINLILTLGTAMRPAILDPQFAGSGLDVGYVTTAPGQREKAFYSSAADRAVIAYDDAHKGIVSLVAADGAVGQVLVPALLNNSRNVNVPVLTVVGDQDILCNTPIIGVDCSTGANVQAHEQPYYANSPSYTAKVVPNTGHNLPLHPSADESFGMIDEWIRQH